MSIGGVPHRNRSEAEGPIFWALMAIPTLIAGFAWLMLFWPFLTVWALGKVLVWLSDTVIAKPIDKILYLENKALDYLFYTYRTWRW